ncbi:MAG: hypothetical protein EAZ91_25345, partial [Cytophagales bacterium]
MNVWLRILIVGLSLCGMAQAQPPVLVMMKKAAAPGGTDLQRIMPELKAALRRYRFPLLDLNTATEARWRIEVTGSTDKCPIDATIPRYTLTLEAFDLKTEEYIATVKATPNCINLPPDELASRAVTALFDNRAFERERTGFFDKIRQYFGNEPVAMATPGDTTGPVIEIFSPALPRGFRPAGRVKPNASVEITGRVADPSRVARLSLNGQVVPFDEEGMFRPTVQMVQSDYRVRLDAEDALGNRRSLEFTLSPQSVSTTAASPEPLTEKRLALVVGNGAYEHVTRLSNPVNDAEAMANALRVCFVSLFGESVDDNGNEGNSEHGLRTFYRFL